MLIRILTENKNYTGIADIVSAYFDSFTMIKTDGYWHGKQEHGLIIEIDDTDIPIDTKVIRQACYAIKKLNKQNKILVQCIECNSMLI